MRDTGKARVSAVASVQAPTSGIDDSSPVANMGTEFAISLVNFYPEGSALRARDGYREQATDLGSTVRTLMAYRAVNPTDNRLFAVTSAGVYDVTIATDAPVLVHPLTNGYVQWTQFGNIAGNWLVGCNGVDAAFLYNGTTWTTFTVSAGSTPGQVTGIVPADIISVCHHKNRVWFLVKDSLTAYYLPLNALSGAAVAFPLGGIAQAGGYANSVFTWTMDAGYSVDDMLVFQTSVGEILVYSGTDPSNASTWFLSARYFAGSPMSRRSQAGLNGDYLLMTEFGLVSLAKVVAGQQGVGARELTTSYRISGALNNLIRARTGSVGWEVVYSPSMQYLILTVPSFSGAPPLQYIMNPVTGAWTTFDLPAVTFIEFDGFVYFSDDAGRVLRHGDVELDNVNLVGTGGEQVVASFKQAYNYFEAPGVNKHYKLVRPVFEAQIRPPYAIALSADFSPLTADDLPTPGGVISDGSTGIWDVTEWGEALWSPPLLAYQEWLGAVDVGYCASIVLKLASGSRTRYVASNVVYEQGVSL